MELEKEGRLNALLAESLDDARMRERAAFHRALQGRDGIVLFGSGHLGKKVARVLLDTGYRVFAFADNSEKKWGSELEGVPILSPQDAASAYGARAALVVTIWAPRHSYIATRAQLAELGFDVVLPFMIFFWSFPDALPHYQFERPSFVLDAADRIRACYTLMADEESRSQFLAHVAWRLTGDYSLLPVPTPEDQYFVDGLIPDRDDLVFLDGGAFDGDTLQRMLARNGARFKRYIALEPDPVNFASLKHYVNELPTEVASRVEVRQAAISDQMGEAAFDATGATRSSISESGDVVVDTVSLDKLLPNDAACLIKMDLEGAEWEALTGAKRLIETRAPDLAVCVYHQPHDLWELPLMLKDWQSDYRFHLRTHDDEGREVVVYTTAG